MSLNRPDITKAQVPAIITAVALFLRAFGVYDLNAEQIEALQTAGAIAVGLALGDAVIRNGRSKIAAAEHGAELTEAVVRAQVGDTPAAREEAIKRDAAEVADAPAYTGDDAERDKSDRES